MAKENGKAGWCPKGKSNTPSVSDDQRAAHPILSALLEGQADKSGEYERFPYALTLFVGEGAIRFSFGSRETGETWFGTIGRSANIVQAVEIALENGDYEAKYQSRNGHRDPFNT